MSAGTYDDTNSLFTYKDNAWVAGQGTGEFDGTHHSSDVSGSVVNFGPFIGSSIQVFSTVGTNQTKLHFTVDGNSAPDVPPVSQASVQFQQQVFSTGGLNPTATHTLVINLLDAGPFTLDYVAVGGQASTGTSSATASVTPTATGVSLLGGDSTPSISPSNPGTPLSSPTASPTASPPTTDTTSSSNSSATASGSGSFISGQTTSSSSTLSTTASSSISPTPLAAASNGGLDATVIGSIAGAIIFFALIVVGAVLYLRRRRQRQPSCRSYSSKPPRKSDTPGKSRPSLRLNIPGGLPNAQRSSSLLPLHNNSNRSATTTTPSVNATSPRSLQFLNEDPIAEESVLDIKQRPASGSTMTTRVTVGTSIGQRASVPDFSYKYAYPDTPAPPVPSLPPSAKLYDVRPEVEKQRPFTDALDVQPSPAETGSSSAVSKSGTVSTFAFRDYGCAGATGIGMSTNDTSIFPSPLERNTSAFVPPGTTGSRPLPYIPTPSMDSKPALGRRALPVAPLMFDPEAYTVVHEDGGVRFTSAGLVVQRELPPPYRNYDA